MGVMLLMLIPITNYSNILKELYIIVQSHWSQEVQVQRRCPSLQTEWETQHPKKGKKHHGKKGHTDIIGMEEFDGHYDEIDIHFVGPYPAMANDPDEIKMDDINRSRKTEAYTIVHLPADCNGKTNASV